MSEPVARGSQWRVRGVLEGAGLRVVDLRLFPERPYRWSVRVLADENAELEIQTLAAVTSCGINGSRACRVNQICSW